jgi:hypothetical protein
MFSLIFVVISIALIVAFTAATVNYVPVDATLRHQMFKEADRGFKAIECAVTRYLDANRDTDTTSPNYNNIKYPGNNVNLVNDVMPKYGFLPANIRKELTWEITTGQVSSLNAVGICLRPVATSTAMQREVLAKVQANMPVGSAFIGSACNATANVANGAYMTYWVPLNHIN